MSNSTGRDGGTPIPNLEKEIPDCPAIFISTPGIRPGGWVERAFDRAWSRATPRSAMAKQHAREREAYREHSEQSYADFIRRVGA